MEEALKRAIKKGWKWGRSKVSVIKRGGDLRFQHDGYTEAINESAILLDPLFWQALGKAEGWEEPEKGNDFPEAEVLDLKQTGWNARWHHFIDHLAAKKPVEDFFKELLENNQKHDN